MSDKVTSIRSPHPEEPRSGVSKDVPGCSRAGWSILRDAISDEMAPQDEGCGVDALGAEDAGIIVSTLAEMRVEMAAWHNETDRRLIVLAHRLDDLSDDLVETLSILQSRRSVWEAHREC